jgi:hypothetical protein
VSFPEEVMDAADLRCRSHCAFVVAVVVAVAVGLRRLWLARAVVERREREDAPADARMAAELHRGTEAKADMVGYGGSK